MCSRVSKIGNPMAWFTTHLLQNIAVDTDRIVNNTKKITNEQKAWENISEATENPDFSLYFTLWKDSHETYLAKSK